MNDLSAMQHAGIILDHCESSNKAEDRALVECVLAAVAAWRVGRCVEHMRIARDAVNGERRLSLGMLAGVSSN